MLKNGFEDAIDYLNPCDEFIILCFKTSLFGFEECFDTDLNNKPLKEMTDEERFELAKKHLSRGNAKIYNSLDFFFEDMNNGCGVENNNFYFFKMPY